jgi:hypothetical protein
VSRDLDLDLGEVRDQLAEGGERRPHRRHELGAARREARERVDDDADLVRLGADRERARRRRLRHELRDVAGERLDARGGLRRRGLDGRRRLRGGPRRGLRVCRGLLRRGRRPRLGLRLLRDRGDRQRGGGRRRERRARELGIARGGAAHRRHDDEGEELQDEVAEGDQPPRLAVVDLRCRLAPGPRRDLRRRAHAAG